MIQFVNDSWFLRLMSITVCFLSVHTINAQNLNVLDGNISGSFVLDAQFYEEDEEIGTVDVPEDIGSAGYLNLLYSSGDFELGLRYESYRNPLLGIDPGFEGSGIPYRYAKYRADIIEVTAGNFYEQFGSGLVLRTYQEWTLAIDNSIDGLRVKLKPIDGLDITGVIGKQRIFFGLGPGIVRGADMNADLNQLLPSMGSSDLKIQLGASAVSKFQADNTPEFVFPENVFAGSGRLNMFYKGFGLQAEYAHKINDPAPVSDSRITFNDGDALLVTASYSQKGLGITLSGKRIDNMDFRSSRAATGNDLTINYLPAGTKQHTYRLATLYTYATQPTGEIGYQGDISYTVPRNTFLGGKYGLNVAFSHSRIHGLDTTNIDEFTYDSEFLSFSDRVHIQDYTLELEKRWTSSFKSTLQYSYVQFDRLLVEGDEVEEEIGMVFANILVGDFLYKFDRHNTVRAEIQHLWTEQDRGNWLYGLIEYSIAPHWFITVFDEYNYGNELEEKQIHFVTADVTFVKNAHRVSLGYGRTRSGLICVGGVCRFVPASSGVKLAITSSF